MSDTCGRPVSFVERLPFNSNWLHNPALGGDRRTPRISVHGGAVRFHKRERALPINPGKYAQNEAWVPFQLNDAPVHTEADGDFDVMAIMDVATGLILGMEFVGVLAEELSEFESRKLLASAESEAGGRPKSLFVDSDKKAARTVEAAGALGLEVIRESGSNLSPITQEAREGFAAHVSGAKWQ